MQICQAGRAVDSSRVLRIRFLASWAVLTRRSIWRLVSHRTVHTLTASVVGRAARLTDLTFSVPVQTVRSRRVVVTVQAFCPLGAVRTGCTHGAISSGWVDLVPGQASPTLCPVGREEVIAQCATSHAGGMVWAGLEAWLARRTFEPIDADHSVSSRRTTGAIHCGNVQIWFIASFAPLTNSDIAVLPPYARVAGRPLSIWLASCGASFAYKTRRAVHSHAELRGICTVEAATVTAVRLLSWVAGTASSACACHSSRTRLTGCVILHGSAAIRAGNALSSIGAVPKTRPCNVAVKAVRCRQSKVRLLSWVTHQAVFAFWRVRTRGAVKAFASRTVGLRTCRAIPARRAVWAEKLQTIHSAVLTEGLPCVGLMTMLAPLTLQPRN